MTLYNVLLIGEGYASKRLHVARVLQQVPKYF